MAMIMRSYLLGLDAGNTVCKAVLFDLEGREIAVSSVEGSSHHPAPGRVERDLDELWEHARTAIRGCLDKARVAPADILAVGCSGHGNGLYLLDQNRAALLGIQSLDSRAGGLVERFKQDGTAEKVYPLALQKPWPSQTPTLLAWIKEHQPERYAQIGAVFLCKDFVTFKLTGELGSDISDMSGCALLKLPEATYDAAILEAFGIADCLDKLPALRAPYDVAGKVTADAARETGLLEGTPVVAGLFDVVASALGSGAVGVGAASIVAGTWSINQVIVEKPLVNDSIFIASCFGKDRFMELVASATSAINLEWFVKEFIEPGGDRGSEKSPFALCDELVASVQPDAGLPIYHPFLYGSSTSGAARAGFYGIGGWHGRKDVLYALYEGVVFGHRQHIETLRSAGASFDKAILSGGASRSPIWPQLFADILQVPVSVATCQETGALGAAMVAGIGAGAFDNYETAARAMTRLGRHFSPNAALTEIYATRYRLYSELCEAMQGSWVRMRSLSETGRSPSG